MLQIVVITAAVIAMMKVVKWARVRLPQKRFACMLWGIFAVYACGGIYCTLFSRVPGSGTTLELRPLMSVVRLFSAPVDAGTEYTGLFAWFMNEAFPLAGIVLNIMLFVPLGYLLPMVSEKLKPSRVVLTGLVCSLLIESLQYLLVMGWSETDDVIYNTLGTAIGLWAMRRQGRSAADGERACSFNGTDL